MARTPGSGRAKGTPNKLTAEIRAILGEFGPKIIRDQCYLAALDVPPGTDPAMTKFLMDKKQAATELLAPYIMPKQAPVDESGQAQSITFKIDKDDAE